MPRSYARLVTSVWDDVDGNVWLELTSKAKYLYFLLTTQSEISACGRLRLTVRSWATMSPDTDSAFVAAALRELVEKRIVLADKDTEEILVRAFVKDDGGFNNRKRIPVIRDAVREIRSRELRAAAIVELERVGLSMGGGPDTDPDRASRSPSEGASSSAPAERANGKHVQAAESVSTQVDRLSGSASDSASASPPHGQSLSGRVAVVQVVGSTPQPTTHIPPPEAHGSELDLGLPPVPPKPVTADAIVADWIDARGSRPTERVLGQISARVKKLLTDEIDPEHIKSGLLAWQTRHAQRANGVPAGQLDEFVDAAVSAASASNVIALPARAQESTTDRRVAMVDEALARAKAEMNGAGA
jgi:hypothetical protein